MSYTEMKEIIGYEIYNLFEEPINRIRLKTKEELFEKMIEIGEVDEFGVVRFKMNPRPTIFGFHIHLYTVAVIGLNEMGSEVSHSFTFRETACHKDGLHKRFLVNY